MLFACIAVANTASLALPISNPTNVVVADRLGLDFVDYARTMVPPALAASIAVALVLGIRFRAQLGGRLVAPVPTADITPRAIAVTSALATSAALAGFAILPHELGAVAFVAGGGAALALLALGAWSPGADCGRRGRACWSSRSASS